MFGFSTFLYVVKGYRVRNSSSNTSKWVEKLEEDFSRELLAQNPQKYTLFLWPFQAWTLPQRGRKWLMDWLRTESPHLVEIQSSPALIWICLSMIDLFEENYCFQYQNSSTDKSPKNEEYVHTVDIIWNTKQLCSQIKGRYFHFKHRERGRPSDNWKYRNKNIDKYTEKLIRKRQLHLSVQTHGSTDEQQMALPAESQSLNITEEVVLFQNLTRGIKVFILVVDSVATVKYQVLFGKISSQNLFLCEFQ